MMSPACWRMPAGEPTCANPGPITRRHPDRGLRMAERPPGGEYQTNASSPDRLVAVARHALGEDHRQTDRRAERLLHRGRPGIPGRLAGSSHDPPHRTAGVTLPGSDVRTAPSGQSRAQSAARGGCSGLPDGLGPCDWAGDRSRWLGSTGRSARRESPSSRPPGCIRHPPLATPVLPMSCAITSEAGHGADLACLTLSGKALEVGGAVLPADVRHFAPRSGTGSSGSTACQPRQRVRSRLRWRACCGPGRAVIRARTSRPPSASSKVPWRRTGRAPSVSISRAGGCPPDQNRRTLLDTAPARPAHPRPRRARSDHPRTPRPCRIKLVTTSHLRAPQYD